MKDWKDLTISDDYMFKLIIKRKRICKQMLERILHIEIEDLSYVGTEKVLIPVYGSKGRPHGCLREGRKGHSLQHRHAGEKA